VIIKRNRSMTKTKGGNVTFSRNTGGARFVPQHASRVPANHLGSDEWGIIQLTATYRLLKLKSSKAIIDKAIIRSGYTGGEARRRCNHRGVNNPRAKLDDARCRRHKRRKFTHVLYSGSPNLIAIKTERGRTLGDTGN